MRLGWREIDGCRSSARNSRQHCDGLLGEVGANLLVIEQRHHRLGDAAVEILPKVPLACGRVRS
jgi:hypothetical protein